MCFFFFFFFFLFNLIATLYISCSSLILTYILSTLQPFIFLHLNKSMYMYFQIVRIHFWIIVINAKFLILVLIFKGERNLKRYCPLK